MQLRHQVTYLNRETKSHFECPARRLIRAPSLVPSLIPFDVHEGGASKHEDRPISETFDNIRVKIRAERQRMYALHCVEECETDSIVSILRPKRSLEQNAKMWAMLQDVARSEPEERQWTPETWKCAFMHALGHHVIFAEALDGSGPFPVGFKTSKLTSAQMSDLITLIQEYGDRHAVVWRDTRKLGWDNAK